MPFLSSRYQRKSTRATGYYVLPIAFLVVSAFTRNSPTEAGQPVIAVRIENLSFSPARLEIPPGTSVRWVNGDTVAHDVTSGESITGRKARGLTKTRFPDGGFASGLFAPGRNYSVTFDSPGEYPYYCNVHPFMQGKISVVK